MSEEAYVPATLSSAGFLMCGVLVNARAPPIGKPAFSCLLSASLVVPGSSGRIQGVESGSAILFPATFLNPVDAG